MALFEKYRRVFLRGERLVAAAALFIPLVGTSILGFFWLGEHGLLLLFIGFCAALGLLLYLLRVMLRWQGSAADTEGAEDEALAVAPDPEWDARQTGAYATARKLIEARTATPVEWEDMPDLALEVVDQVARSFGEAKKSALDFTMPEALLLVERVASRYRHDLKEKLPFSDRISLRTMHWLWMQRDRAQIAFGLAQAGHRLARLALNPAASIMREIEQIVAGGHSGYLGTQAMGVLQAVLLEEVAYAAVELYSGHLRFSDSELLEMQLAASALDRDRIADPDGPLRIVFAGQASSGKSSLINALLGTELAETDMRPTTERVIAYETRIGGVECLLIDSPGLDGSDRTREVVLEALHGSDIAVWVVRANRPARAIDQRVLSELNDWFAANAERRKPPLITVATFADRLAPDWPYPDHALPLEFQRKVSDAARAIAADLGSADPIPVSSVSPDWNVESICRAIESALGDGLMTQRNRLRVEGGRHSGLVTEVLRGGRGLVKGTQVFGWRLARRTLGIDKDD